MRNWIMWTTVLAALACAQEAPKAPVAPAGSPSAPAKAEGAKAEAPRPKPAPPAPKPKTDLAQVRTVYLMKMGMGLDQYLSQRLVEKDILTVVTDPALADAFFTDHLGAAFEAEFRRLTVVEEESGDEKTTKEKADALWVATRSTFGRGRGNIFLVDRASGAVLWSLYERPKTGQPQELNKTAGRIVVALAVRIKGASK